MRFVIGVGLPLYYNSLLFLLILSLLLFVCTHLALNSESQSLFNYSGVSSNPVQVVNVPIYPSAEGAELRFQLNLPVFLLKSFVGSFCLLSKASPTPRSAAGPWRTKGSRASTSRRPQ